MYLNGKYISTDNPTQCIKQPISISNHECENHLGSTFEGLAVAEAIKNEAPKIEYFTKFDIDPELLYADAPIDEHGGEVKSVDVEIREMTCTADNHVIICVNARKGVQTKRAFEIKSAHAILKYTDKGKYEAICQLADRTIGTCILPSGKDGVVSFRYGIQFFSIPKMVPGKTVGIGRECSGVAVIKEMLYVGGHSQLHILDQIGRFYKTINVPCNPQSICQNIDGRLYCASFDTFYCLTRAGSFVYSYNSSDLGEITAVKVDTRGIIYVAGSELQAFYPHASRVDRILRKEDGNTDISALCFNNDFSKMFTSHNKEKFVKIYTVQNAQ